MFSVNSVVNRYCRRVTVSDGPVKYICQCWFDREHHMFFKAGRALKMPYGLSEVRGAGSHNACDFALGFSEQSAEARPQ